MTPQEPQAPPLPPAGPFTPARPPRNAGLHTGIDPAGQERRSSDRHRPRRNAGLQTGIARTAGETPIALPPHGAAGPQAPPVLPAGPFTPARPPRNAGLQTGIARSAGETPVAPPRLALQDQERRQSSRRGPSHRHARQERRSSDRHRPLRGRNSRRPSRPGAAGSGAPPVLPAGAFTPARPPRNAGLQTGIARSAGETPIAPPRLALPDHKRRQSSRRELSHRHARPGTPVFRPASPAPRAKLPSPLPAWRCRTTSAASPPGGALHTGTPARNAGLQTGIARSAGETPVAPPRTALHKINSHRPSRPGAAGSGAPPVLPVGAFTPAPHPAGQE